MAKNPDWSAEEQGLLKELYPGAFPCELAALFPGRTVSGITQHANLLGLQHSARTVHFPARYLNDEDGGYVSGLVDGEGCFMVSVKQRQDKTNFNPKMGISLRIDDIAILEWVQAYFDCGRIQRNLRARSPLAMWVVADLYSILAKVMPHFDKYPLRAKKKQDYSIWRKMVLLQAKYWRLPWPDEVREQMSALYDALKQTRKLQGE